MCASPERLGSFEADMWSLGCCLFAMLRASYPLFGTTDPSPFAAMLKQELKTYSRELQDLINNLLVFDPWQRLTVEEAVKVMPMLAA